MLNRKVIINHLIVGLIKITLLYKMSCFPEPYTRTKIWIRLSKYATKSELKKAIDVNISDLVDLANFKSVVNKVDKLDVNKLKPVPLDLKNVSGAVEKEVVKKDVYDKLVKKVNAIQTTDTNNLVTKADYDTKIAEIEKKILYHNHDNYYSRTESVNDRKFYCKISRSKINN